MAGLNRGKVSGAGLGTSAELSPRPLTSELWVSSGAESDTKPPGKHSQALCWGSGDGVLTQSPNSSVKSTPRGRGTEADGDEGGSMPRGGTA